MQTGGVLLRATQQMQGEQTVQGHKSTHSKSGTTLRPPAAAAEPNMLPAMLGLRTGAAALA
jgi:hypothetical protein